MRRPFSVNVRVSQRCKLIEDKCPDAVNVPLHARPCMFAITLQQSVDQRQMLFAHLHSAVGNPHEQTDKQASALAHVFNERSQHLIVC